MSEAVTDGLHLAERDHETFRLWLDCRVSENGLRRWTDDVLGKRWGVLAAARAYHIVRTGRDASFADPFEKAPPTQRRMKPGRPVPGAIVPVTTLFAAIQVLAWLAAQRTQVAEQLRWMDDIPGLVVSLSEGV
jgi:hypothetical protein